MSDKKVTMDKIVNLAKGRGFIFAGSEIYGGLANTWDFGPLGVELKNNIKAAWWKKFVTEPETNIGLDSAILTNPAIWRATGHIGGKFDDPLMDCKSCKSRHRADNLIEKYSAKKKVEINISALNNKQMEDYIAEKNILCPVCGNCNFTPIRQFNLLFKTFQGVTEDSASVIYLRPETAQGIFINFNNIVRSMRRRVPFGVGQIGKSFRNEITPGNFIFRVREFEQMELEFFCKPGTDLEWFDYWKNYCKEFLLSLGMKENNLRLRDHKEEELCFYSKATTDFEYEFPFGWGELWGIADRTDYDLLCHQKATNKPMEYTDPVTQEKYIPYCIEPSLGVERVLLAFLCDAYEEQVLEKDETRVVLKLHPALAPFKVAVLPLQKKLGEKATEIYQKLSKEFNVDYDESGSIGKRYRRQDEIGTPLCVTVDFDTLTDNTVTVRNRDTMEQIRLNAEELNNYVKEFIKF